MMLSLITKARHSCDVTAQIILIKSRHYEIIQGSNAEIAHQQRLTIERHQLGSFVKAKNC